MYPDGGPEPGPEYDKFDRVASLTSRALIALILAIWAVAYFWQ